MKNDVTKIVDNYLARFWTILCRDLAGIGSAPLVDTEI
jgi:hypothetical protein